jgi:imidazolonepropionase-like amidohydrolase
MEAMGGRNLAFLAGATTRYGLSNEEALQLITRNPARILGLEHRCGALEKDRDATFFLSRGDALDMRTQDLTRAWIQGRPVSTESKQTLLFRKFKDKPEPGRPR